MFTENLLWKKLSLLTRTNGHVWAFRIFTPFRVKEASTVNKITRTSCECSMSQW
jgi:hypothetical protein